MEKQFMYRCLNRCLKSRAFIFSSLALALTYGAMPLSAGPEEEPNVGRFDESRARDFLGEPSVSRKEDSVTLFERKPGADEKEARKASRLRAIEGRVYTENKGETGHQLFLRARSMGVADSSLLEKRGKALEAWLRRLLADNEAITRRAKDVDFEILKVIESPVHGHKVVFKQILNGIPLERPSSVGIDPSGNVTQLQLFIAEPSSPSFDQSTWIPYDALLDLSERAWEDKFGRLPPDDAQDQYLIVFDPVDTEFIPVLELRAGSRLAQVHAITGATIRADDMTAGATLGFRGQFT